MADKNIGSLDQAQDLRDDSMLVVEQQGQAMKVSGAQFKEFGRQAVIGQVQGYVDQAQAAAGEAVDAVSAVTDMTVEAQTLETGQDAAVTKTIKNGVVGLVFGLPRGEQGVPGPTGDTGPRGPQGPTGKGLTILGYYDTLTALEAAVPSPETGDAYGVGTAAPYDVYVFDGVSGSWKDNGQLSGGGGGPLPENVVTAEGGASVSFPLDLGDGPHTITFAQEEEPPLTAEDIGYSGTQTVKDAIDGLKSSVSNGKSLIASAITDKGVATAQDATFQQMADHIEQIGGGSDTSDATATSFDILAGKTAYTATGKVAGTIPTLAAQTITPGTADKTISNGQYLGGTQTIKGDPNLTSGNIKKGVSIFGVAGAVEQNFLATLTVTADTGAVVTATHTSGAQVEALSTNGTVTLELPLEGKWTVTARRGVAQYNAVTIQVTSQYSAALTAEVHIEYYGTVANLSTARQNASGGTIGDYAVFLGGISQYTSSSSHSCGDLDIYDKNLVHSSQNNWTIAGTYISANAGQYVLFSYGDNGFYCDLSLTKLNLGALSEVRSKFASVSIGNYALFGGGYYDRTGNVSSTVDSYDENLTRTTLTPLSIAAYRLNAASNGPYAIFAGGLGASNSYISAVTAYDSQLTRTTPTRLGVARSNLGAACAGNHVLLAGGKSGSNESVSTVDSYDLFLTHSVQEGLGSARRDIASAHIHGYALFAGGNEDHGAGTIENAFRSSLVDCYDPYLVRTVPKYLSEEKSFVGAATIGDFALFAGGFIYRSGAKVLSAVVDVYQYV